MNITELLTTTFVMLSLGSYALTFIILKMFEFLIDIGKLNKNNKVFQDLVKPLSPLGLGALLGYMVSNNLLQGLVAGLLSGLIYRVVKALIKKSAS